MATSICERSLARIGWELFGLRYRSVINRYWILFRTRHPHAELDVVSLSLNQTARLCYFSEGGYQRPREQVAYPGTTAAAEHLANELDRAHKDKLSATHVLESLLDIEVIATKARRTRGRLRFAHYPVHKSLAEFDFDFQPSLDRKVVAELSTLWGT